jgi:hypothetical protein
MRLLQMTHHLALLCGLHHFLETTSFKATLSSVKSATKRFSLLFSASRERNRFASDTSNPPNFDFHL